jgi:hypothetical protein
VWGDETPSNWWGPMSRGTDHGGAGGTNKPAARFSAASASPTGARARAPATVSARKRQAQKKSRSGKSRGR